MSYNVLKLYLSFDCIIISINNKLIFVKELLEDATNYGYFDNLVEVGFNITMKRVQQPYLLKYYLPCIAIVTVTQISFYIPPDAIPGRIALLVTQFLTLTNLFISEQVRNI